MVVKPGYLLIDFSSDEESSRKGPIFGTEPVILYITCYHLKLSVFDINDSIEFLKNPSLPMGLICLCLVKTASFVSGNPGSDSVFSR